MTVLHVPSTLGSDVESLSVFALGSDVKNCQSVGTCAEADDRMAHGAAEETTPASSFVVAFVRVCACACVPCFFCVPLLLSLRVCASVRVRVYLVFFCACVRVVCGFPCCVSLPSAGLDCCVHAHPITAGSPTCA